ncbi:MAG TPA: PAS domain-containing protein [Ureibacillus sp.]|nr:PAS domain-containing protein [Ureibacillus sp.]
MNDPFQFVHPHDYEFVYEKVNDAMLNGKSYTVKFRILHGKHHDLRHLHVHGEAVLEDGKPKKLIGVVKDETYQIQLENKLREQNENYQYVFDNLSSGIWIRENASQKFTFASKGLEDILELPNSKLYEDPNIWYDMIHPDYHQELVDAKKKLAAGESLQTIYRLISGTGKTKWLLEQVVPRKNSVGQVINIFGLVTDVTNEMMIEEKLAYLSNFDSLTGLPNQKSIFERLDTMCESDEPFSIF